MKKAKRWVAIVALLGFLVTGCTTAGWIIGGVVVVGAGVATYIYLNKELKVDHPHAFDTVWTACQKAMADLHATNVEAYKEIDKKTIYALVNGEKVTITVTYKSKTVTNVAVQVGAMGDKAASKFILDKISENLGKN